jgi:hypothetical protein
MESKTYKYRNDICDEINVKSNVCIDKNMHRIIAKRSVDSIIN